MRSSADEPVALHLGAYALCRDPVGRLLLVRMAVGLDGHRPPRRAVSTDRRAWFDAAEARALPLTRARALAVELAFGD